MLNSINHNEKLFGILLGYGQHNAILYEKLNYYRKPPFFHREKIKLGCFQEFHPIMKINPVQFKADLDYPETKMLQRKYKNLQKKISHILDQENFLEIILSQLVNGDSVSP